MASNQQSPPSLEEFRAAKAAQEKKAPAPSLEEFRAAKAAQEKKAPEIPAAGDPAKARAPFAEAPPKETGGATLGPMGLMGSALPSTSARGTAPSVSPQQKRDVLALGKGPISLESPEAQEVIAPKKQESSIFVPGTEKFATAPPKFDADKRRIDAVNERMRTTEYGYKLPSIDREVAEDPAIMREMYDKVPSEQERKRLESLLQYYSTDFSPGIQQERRRIQDLLELDDAMKNVTPTLVIDDPRKELYHHSRVLQKQADKESGGDVGKYMRRMELNVIAPNYLTTAEEKRQAEILDKITIYSQTVSQLMAKGDSAGAEVFKKETAKLRDEYSRIVAKSQADTIREIRELGESMDPADQKRATALSAKLDMFFEPDPQKKAQVALKAAGVETADQKLFGKMSSIDIARLALHTKYMQLEKRLGTNAMARLWNNTFDSDVEKLKEEIELLAPAVILNQTPIQNIDKGFFGVAIPSFADPFGGSGTSQKKSQMLQETLGSIGALDNVKSRPALRASGDAYDPWSKEEWGGATGSSTAFMVELVPMTVATEGTFAVLGVGSRMMTLINTLKASRSTRLVGRLLNTAYDAAKQGAAYEAAGRLYDSRDEMNFASGFVGGAVGKWSQGKADDLLKGFEKKVKMVFGNKSKDVADAVINYGKKMTVQGARTVGTGVGETAEEFGEALGGIIDKSDTAGQVIDGIKEQFPDASSTFHFAMQSFIMGAMMGQGTTVGRSLWARSKKFYDSLSSSEKKSFDDVVQEMNNEVNEEAQKETSKQKEEREPEEPMKTTEQAVAAVAETPATTKASGSDTWMSDEQKERLAELETLGGVAEEPASGFVDAEVAAAARQAALGEGVEGEAAPAVKRELTPEEKTELESLRAIQGRQQEHDQMLESRREKGVTFNPLEDIPVQIVTTFDRMEADLPVSLTALDAASDWLYNRYKDIVAMKSDPLRPMTTAEIDNYTNQLAEDISALENYKLKIKDQVGGAEVETQPKPTTDAVQERTTAEVGAQPVGTEGAGQEGRGGVGPSVQGPEAPQAGGPQGQVTPTAEGPVRPEAPPAVQKEPSITSTDTPPKSTTSVVSEGSSAIGFTTSKGSTYEVNEEGQTIRTKKSEGRGKGETYQPHNVLFVTTEEANNLLEELRGGAIYRFVVEDANSPTGARVIGEGESIKGKKIALGLFAKDGKLIKYIPSKTQPKVGLHPVELRYETRDGERVGMRHVGNAIVSINEASPATTASPAQTAAPTPNKETVAKMKELDKIEEKMSSGAKKLNAPAKKAFDKMVAADPRIDQVKRANFDKAVADLEKSGKLKVRCP